MSAPDRDPRLARRIAFLDYLRVFAFLSVLVGHKFYEPAVALTKNAEIHATPRYLLELALPLFYAGGAGVVVFFLVSGYIIAHVLQKEGTAEFLVKRAFRIYPLYAFALVLQTFYVHSLGVPLDWPVFFQQLFLVGDLFDTPHALWGVEWTLRVEVCFYLLMAALRGVGLMHRFRRALPWVLVATAITLGKVAPIPSQVVFRAYLTTYAVFLLLGVVMYLREVGQIGVQFLIGFTLLAFYHHYGQLSEFRKDWLAPHFAALGYLVFLGAWLWRNPMVAPRSVLMLSELTYSVYLFHNWGFDILRNWLARVSTPRIDFDVQTVVCLFAFCYLTVRLIEKPGVAAGRMAAGLLKRRPKPTAAAPEITPGGGVPGASPTAIPLEPGRKAGSGRGRKAA